MPNSYRLRDKPEVPMLASGECLISPRSTPPDSRTAGAPIMTPEKAAADLPAPIVVEPATFLMILMRALGAMHT
jgi:hypothetical protein